MDLVGCASVRAELANVTVLRLDIDLALAALEARAVERGQQATCRTLTLIATTKMHGGTRRRGRSFLRGTS
jgi:hypothetical protein